MCAMAYRPSDADCLSLGQSASPLNLTLSPAGERGVRPARADDPA